MKKYKCASEEEGDLSDSDASDIESTDDTTNIETGIIMDN